MYCISFSDINPEKQCENIKKPDGSFCRAHNHLIKKYMDYKVLQNKILDTETSLKLDKNMDENQLLSVYSKGLKFIAMLKNLIQKRELFTEKYIFPKYRDVGHELIVKILNNKLVVLESGLRQLLNRIQIIRRNRIEKIENNEENDEDKHDEKQSDHKTEEKHADNNIKLLDEHQSKIANILEQIYDPLLSELRPKYKMRKIKDLLAIVDKWDDEYLHLKSHLRSILIETSDKELDLLKKETALLKLEKEFKVKVDKLIMKDYEICEIMGDFERNARTGKLLLTPKIINEQKQRLSDRIKILREVKNLCKQYKIDNDYIRCNIKDMRTDIWQYVKIIKNIMNICKEDFENDDACLCPDCKKESYKEICKFYNLD